jgi:hypothetical protein
LGGQDQLQPHGVAAPGVEGEVGQAGGLAGADAVFDAGVLAVAKLQPGDIPVSLVGDKDLVAAAWASVKRTGAPGWGVRGGRSRGSLAGRNPGPASR